MPRFLMAVVMCVGLFQGRPPSAQGSVADHFDTTKPIALKGKHAGLFAVPDRPAYLLIDVQDGSGKIERWAVQGSSMSVLLKAGWNLGRGGPVKLGDSITVMAFRAKPAANLTETVPTFPPDLLEAAKAGRLVHGTEIILPDGKKLPFG
jgi:hypothetical protein